MKYSTHFVLLLSVPHTDCNDGVYVCMYTAACNAPRKRRSDTCVASIRAFTLRCDIVKRVLCENSRIRTAVTDP